MGVGGWGMIGKGDIVLRRSGGLIPLLINITPVIAAFQVKKTHTCRCLSLFTAEVAGSSSAVGHDGVMAYMFDIIFG